jgi:hypothetical protein
MDSQFYEGGANGSADLLVSDPAKQQERRRQIRESFAGRNQSLADRFRENLKEWYGADAGAKVRHAEAFEICEYGAQPDRAQLKKLFPFVGE